MSEMTKCPKCSGTEIGGPIYLGPKPFFPYELLRYTCMRCGYQQDGPTHDNRGTPACGEGWHQ